LNECARTDYLNAKSVGIWSEIGSAGVNHDVAPYDIAPAFNAYSAELIIDKPQTFNYMTATCKSRSIGNHTVHVTSNQHAIKESNNGTIADGNSVLVVHVDPDGTGRGGIRAVYRMAIEINNHIAGPHHYPVPVGS
jgi:hypothetical protein